MADAYRGMNEEPGTGRPALSVPPNTPPLMLGVRLTAPAGREPDEPGHGLVEPERRVPAEDYQRALEATRPSWTINEPAVATRSSST